MKIPDFVINMLLKKIIGCDMNSFNTTIEVPNQNPQHRPMKITITADSLKIKVNDER